jgi:hypothetical protein
MTESRRKAGQFFLETAVILYDDLARRAGHENAAKELVQRQVSSARRLDELIDLHGYGQWEAQRRSLNSADDLE